MCVNALIPVVKNKCNKPEFLNLDENLRNLEDSVEKGTLKNFRTELEEFKVKLENSAFLDTYTFGARFDKLKGYLTGLNEKIFWVLLEKIEDLDGKVEKILKGMKGSKY